jgi:hypothetical protein
LDRIPVASLKSEQYVELVTEFYSKYPQDRALPLRLLLLKLLKPAVTVDGIHEWLDKLVESARRSEAKH